jgi:hypothetical protein
MGVVVVAEFDLRLASPDTSLRRHRPSIECSPDEEHEPDDDRGHGEFADELPGDDGAGKPEPGDPQEQERVDDGADDVGGDGSSDVAAAPQRRVDSEVGRLTGEERDTGGEGDERRRDEERQGSWPLPSQ